MSERIGVFGFKAFEEKRDQKGSHFGIMAILIAKRGKSNFCRICREGFFLFSGNVGWAVGEIYFCFVPNLKMSEKS